eukprot:gene191-805_t
MASLFLFSLATLVLIKYVLKSTKFKQQYGNVEKRLWYKLALLLSSIGPVILILLSSNVIYFVWFFPIYHRPLIVNGVLCAGSYCYLWLNIAFNYLATMFNSAGQAFTAEELEAEGYSSVDKIDFCQKCLRLKCQGTHHCSQCQCCIRLFSHHCESANNCIGLNNYSYFYSFLVYSVLGSLFMVQQLWRPFLSCYIYQKSTKHEKVETNHCKVYGDLPRSSNFRFVIGLCQRLCKRRFLRHRANHLLWERKLHWLGYFVPSLHEPPIDMSAEDVIDYEKEYSHVIEENYLNGWRMDEVNAPLLSDGKDRVSRQVVLLWVAVANCVVVIANYLVVVVVGCCCCCLLKGDKTGLRSVIVVIMRGMRTLAVRGFPYRFEQFRRGLSSEREC